MRASQSVSGQPCKLKGVAKRASLASSVGHAWYGIPTERFDAFAPGFVARENPVWCARPALRAHITIPDTITYLAHARYYACTAAVV